MPLPTQKARAKNIELVKKLIAQCMPDGAHDRQLKAILGTYGFSRTAIDGYLLDLQESEQIVWDSDNELWKLPGK